jgi:tetratricopeptide (TPR) repeat protein
VPEGRDPARSEIQSSFRDGLNALKRGRLAEAERFLELTLKRDQGHVAARINLALVYDRRGDRDEALRELRAAARVDGTRPEAYVNLGAILAEAGRVTDALDYLRRALQLDASLVEAHYNLDLHIETDSMTRRSPPSTALIQLAPDLFEALHRGLIPRSAADARGLSPRSLSCAISRHAATPITWEWPRRADRRDAIRMLETTVQLMPDNPRAHVTWASPTIAPRAGKAPPRSGGPAQGRGGRITD